MFGKGEPGLSDDEVGPGNPVHAIGQDTWIHLARGGDQQRSDWKMPKRVRFPTAMRATSLAAKTSHQLAPSRFAIDGVPPRLGLLADGWQAADDLGPKALVIADGENIVP